MLHANVTAIIELTFNLCYRRVCMYDMPGTGWSDAALVNNPVITAQVIEAMNEPGPFLILGNMDDGDQRAYQYALDHPENVKAVIPVVFGDADEFSQQANFYGWAEEETLAVAASTLQQRMYTGDFINAIGVCWGIIPFFATNPTYVPQEKAAESIFLNIYNEKQWTTNINVLYNGVHQPSRWVSKHSLWAQRTDLDPAIPVFGFRLDLTTDQLLQQCIDFGYAVDSIECEFVFYDYNTTRTFNEAVVARNPLSRLFACTSCEGTNAFVINQEANIPWFAETLMTAVGDIRV